MDSVPATTQVEEVLFGQTVRDPERWLEVADDPAVVAWLERQDARARQVLEGLPTRDIFERRLEELVYVERKGVPSKRGSRVFFWVRNPDDEKAIHYVQDGAAQARVLLDPHTMSEDGSLSIGGVYPSKDGQLVAYLEHPNNADEATLRVMDVNSGQLRSTDTITDLRHTSVGWDKLGTGFYYTWLPPKGSVPEAQRGAFAEPRYHRLGTDPKDDPKVYPATGSASKFIGGHESFDGTHVVVAIHDGWEKNEIYLRRKDGNLEPISDDALRASFTRLAPEQEAHFDVTIHAGFVYIHTDMGAPKFRLFRTPVDKLEVQHWQEIVAEDEAVLEHVQVIGDHLVVRYLRNAQSDLQVRRLDGKPLHQVKLPGIGSVAGVSGLPDDQQAYFAFSSFTHPMEVHAFDVGKPDTRLYAREATTARPEDFVVEQQWYPSKDGTRISMFIVYKKGTVRDGRNPTLLTGYGGFASSMTPWFSADLFAWLERGGVYALPNLRGGAEYGEQWHEAGMLGNKQNVFDDFIAAAEFLIAQGYTSAPRLGIRGGSNGGLLVGAAMIQRPELFGAVICSVPLLDMLRYHKFGLGRAWIPEYGDPEIEEHFRWLYAYSPYHHVRDGLRYPPLLMMSADTDDRVDPMHARKFVARMLKANPAAEANILLRVERQAGHAGADLRHKQVARRADEYAFLWEHLAR